LKSLGELAKSPVDLLDWLRRHLPQLVGPTIDSFTPAQGQRGTVLTIDGANFSTARTDNAVTVGGAPAFVLAASPTSLTVLTGADTDTGPIEVTIGGRAATSMANFVVTGYPDPGDTDDGPPVVTQGAGDPQPGDVNPIGTVRVLVVMLRSSDTTPPNPASVRSTVSNAWDNVHTYYDQVSYGRTNVAVDLTDFAVLDGTLSTFLDTSINNFSQSQLGRIAAIGADAAVKQGFTLNAPVKPRGTVVGKTRIVDVIDKGAGKGAVVYTERKITDKANGELIATVTQATFCRADGGFGGPARESPPVHKIPDRARRLPPASRR
jgi:hypothetical protein